MSEFAEVPTGCCTACDGLGGGTYGMCWDCRGTGCAHPEPLCPATQPRPNPSAEEASE